MSSITFDSVNMKGHGRVSSNGASQPTISNGHHDTCAPQSPTALMNGFHQNSHDLAMVFSQVPWMRFNIVAQPDLSMLASNPILKTFIEDITSVTVSTVTKEIHEEVTNAISQVINNVGSTVQAQMTKVHQDIMKEIVSVSAHSTSTDSGRLGVPPFELLLEDLLSGVSKKLDHVCSPPVAQPLDKTGGDDKSKPVDPASTNPVVFPIPKEPKKELSPPPPYQMPTPVTEPPKVEPVTPSFPLPGPAPAPMPPPVPVVKKPTILSFPSLQSTPWVWTPEVQRTPKPRVGHTRAFRRTITTSTPVNALTISITCDDLYTLYVNGKLVGCGKEWMQPENYTIKFPPTSKVVVAVLGSQGPLRGDMGLSVSAIAYDAYSPYEAKTSTSFQTDSKWVCLVDNNFPPNFFKVDFKDSAWSAAFIQNTPWRQSKMGGITPGKAFGKRIIGEKKVPDAPDADSAELLKA